MVFPRSLVYNQGQLRIETRQWYVRADYINSEVPEEVVYVQWYRKAAGIVRAFEVRKSEEGEKASRLALVFSGSYSVELVSCRPW